MSTEVQTVTLVERATLRSAESMMRMYTDAQSATLDLIDNAIDNRVEGRTLSIAVRIQRDEVMIRNQGGEGLDLKGLENFLNWGHSEKTTAQIGQYGVGGKAAMGFLGKSIEVRCSPKDSDTEFYLYDPNWQSKGEVAEKIHQCQIRPAPVKEGYFSVKITGLDPNRLISADHLVTRLGNVYRPLFNNGSIKITVNGKEVRAQDVKYRTDDQRFLLRRLRTKTGFGDEIYIQVGVLAEGGGVRPGIRCYYRGRLLEEGHFFGQPTPADMPQMAKLIGEVSLDFLAVKTQKEGFVKDLHWDEVSKAIQRAINPLVEALATLEMRSTSIVERYEKDLIKQAKRLFEHVLNQTGLITKAMLAGESVGRLPPTTIGIPHQVGQTGQQEVKPREGATAPHIDAIVGETVKRWGPLHGWDIVALGDTSIMAQIVETGLRKTLIVNSDYPMYQAAKGAGEDALILYQIEAAVLQIGQEIFQGRSVVEFKQWVDQAMKEMGASFQMQISERRHRSFSKGSITFRKRSR